MNITNRRRVILEQGSDAWHEFRRSHCNASEAPAALGIGHFMPKNALELCEVRNGTRKVFESSAMRAGHVWEPEVRAHIEETYSDMVEPQVWACEIDGIPLACSLDGLNMDGLIDEIKCPSSPTSDALVLARNGRIAAYYMIQMQHQMLVTGAVKCRYSVRDPELIDPDTTKPKIHTLFLDAIPSVQAEILEAWKRIWPHLRDGTVPAKAEGDEMFELLCCEWLALKDEYDRIEAEMKGLREKIIAACGDNDKLEASCGVVVRKSERKGNVQYAKVPELRGVDLEPYRGKSSTVWTVESKRGGDE